MAFNAAFQSAAVSRLAFTHKNVPEDLIRTMNELAELLASNYKAYRAAMATDSHMSTVPFIAPDLNALVFCYEFHRWDKMGELINFALRNKCAEIIFAFLRYQGSQNAACANQGSDLPYNFQRVDSLVLLLSNINFGVDDIKLYNMSMVDVR